MKSVWQRVYTGLYSNGAKVKTEVNDANDEICLTIKRDRESPDNQFVMTREHANEIAYALISAIKLMDENNAPEGDPE